MTAIFYLLQILMFISVCLILLGVVTLIADGMGLIPLAIGILMFILSTWGACAIYVAHPEIPMCQLTDDLFVALLDFINYFKI